MRAEISFITPDALYHKQLYGHDPALLDVRTQTEYRAGHIPGAKLIPIDELLPQSLDEHFERSTPGNSETLYLTCQSGQRAEAAAERLMKAGYTNLALVAGGTTAWEQAGLPMTRHGNAISLERQLQIAIGSLLVLKVLLGFSVNELFFALTAIIGAGLILAGMTRWCGMTELIARMPWNQSCNRNGQAQA